MKIKVGKIYIRKNTEEYNRKVKITEIRDKHIIEHNITGEYLTDALKNTVGTFSELFFKQHYKPITNKIKKL